MAVSDGEGAVWAHPWGRGCPEAGVLGEPRSHRRRGGRRRQRRRRRAQQRQRRVRASTGGPGRPRPPRALAGAGFLAGALGPVLSTFCSPEPPAPGWASGRHLPPWSKRHHTLQGHRVSQLRKDPGQLDGMARPGELRSARPQGCLSCWTIVP